MLETVFVLKNRQLSYGQFLVFRMRVATDSGMMYYEANLEADEEQSNSTDTRVTLRCDLNSIQVLPGTYHWELMLKEKNGKEKCLMPMCDNSLCVYENIMFSAEDSRE